MNKNLVAALGLSILQASCAYLTLLRERMNEARQKARGELVYARYDAPHVPGFMRRNEIWIEVGPAP